MDELDEPEDDAESYDCLEDRLDAAFERADKPWRCPSLLDYDERICRRINECEDASKYEQLLELKAAVEQEILSGGHAWGCDCKGQ